MTFVLAIAVCVLLVWCFFLDRALAKLLRRLDDEAQAERLRRQGF